MLECGIREGGGGLYQIHSDTRLMSFGTVFNAGGHGISIAVQTFHKRSGRYPLG